MYDRLSMRETYSRVANSSLRGLGEWAYCVGDSKLYVDPSKASYVDTNTGTVHKYARTGVSFG